MERWWKFWVALWQVSPSDAYKRAGYLILAPKSYALLLYTPTFYQSTARIVDAVRIPRIAPSLGGVESLIEQPLVMSYYECTPEERRQYGIPDNMIRMSCGIENAADLIEDLAEALEA